MQLDDLIEQPFDGVDSLGRFSGESWRTLVKACCQGPTARRFVLSMIEPYSAALRADVDHYIIDVLGLKLDRALRTRTAVIR